MSTVAALMMGTGSLAETGRAAEAGDFAECGGSFVIDCIHTHYRPDGSISQQYYCDVYTEGDSHYGVQTGILETDKGCLHYGRQG